MGGRRKKKLEAAKNKRLDIFLAQLQIEDDKRKQIIKYVEDLTFETLQGKSSPKLRLQNPIEMPSFKKKE